MPVQGRSRRRREGARLNPFVVMCDVTVSVILCLSVCIALLSMNRTTDVSSLRKRIAELERSNATLKKENAALQDELKELRAQMGQGVPTATAAARDTVKQALEAVPANGWSVRSGFDSVLVRFDAGGLFASGQDGLLKTGAVDALAQSLAALIPKVRQLDPNGNGRTMEIQVQGHTDRQGEPTYDNWGLAMRRANSVRQQLLKDPRLQPFDYLFSVAAYRWHRPVRSEPYAAGQVDVQENRRIDVRIIFHNPRVPADSQISIRPMDANGVQH